MALMIGQIENFDVGNDNWIEYMERVEMFFVANGITEEPKKKGILLTIIGAEAYGLLRDLLAPIKPKDKSLADITETLKKHLNPTPIKIAERYKFYERNQQTGEPLNKYLAELRKLTEHCQFGQFLNEALCDRFVCGMSNSSIRKRLLTDKDLDLEKAITVALSLESSIRENEQMKVKTESANTVHKVNDGRKRCYRCDSDTHLADKCRHINTKCSKCTGRGHIARACRNERIVESRGVPKSKTNTVSDADEPTADRYDCDEPTNAITDEDEVVLVYNIKGVDPYIIGLNLNSKPINFEIDTGAGRSILSEKTYRHSLSHIPLEKANIILKTYSGEKLVVLGKILVRIDYNGNQLNEHLYVVKGNGPTLLGRDLLTKIKLDWSSVYKVTDVTDKLRELKARYAGLFSDELGKMTNFQAKIHVSVDAVPKFCKPRKVPFALQEGVLKELKKMENEGVLSSIAYSDWASPTVIVPKADGQIRICGDFKSTINPFINTEQYPLPGADELFQKMQGGKRFSKLDLRTAYLQMELDESSRKYLVVNTEDGLKRFNRMPYGITSGPAIFQRKLEQELRDIGMTVVNMDDILISGKDEEDHFKNLELVLQKLADLGLTLNVKKCKFFEKSIEYVGFILSENGIQTNPEKVKPVIDAPEPKNVTELQSFLGATNYYGKFIKDLSNMASPLYALLKKETPWSWGEEESKAMSMLKSRLTSTPVLCIYDKKLPLKLDCDASSYGVGAVLSHVYPDKSERPIAFASRTLTGSEKNYSQLDKEALSVIFGVNKFNQYLFGRKFSLSTDNKALKYILDKNASLPPLAAARIVRWQLFLAAYDFDVEFKPTKKHANADMLSRLPVNSKPVGDSINSIYYSQINSLPVTMDQMQKATQEDRVLKQVMEYLSKNGWPDKISDELRAYYTRRNELSLHDGVIMWNLRVLVPFQFREKVLLELHNGHPGIIRMKGLSRIHVWYPGIDKDIEQLVSRCHECCKNKKKPAKAFIHPWDWPTNPFDRVHVDFFSLYGKDYLLLADSHSKWIELELMKTTKTWYMIEILRSWFARNGMPKQLVSDNGPQFISDEFDKFLVMNGIKHIRSSAYHPCSNGGAERFVQTVKHGLKACHIEKGDMMKKLANFLLAYRTTPSTVTGRTPSELFLGRLIRTRLQMLKPDMSIQKDESELDRKMLKYQSKMSQRTSGRQNIRTFQPGQNVRIVNHVDKHKWDFGVIVRKIALRTYIVKIKGREVKRHIDDIDLNYSLLPPTAPIADNRDHDILQPSNGIEPDDTWMYGELENGLVRPPGRSPRNSTRNRVQIRASTRPRIAVDRYGMVPYE